MSPAKTEKPRVARISMRSPLDHAWYVKTGHTYSFFNTWREAFNHALRMLAGSS